MSHSRQANDGTTEVVAVLIAITELSARVLTVDMGDSLPSGPLMPLHRSLQAGVRQWVEEQTQQPLGYIEQLYTFVDTHRRNELGHALVYVSYLGLVQEADTTALAGNAAWQDWYTYFPWENHQRGVPTLIATHLLPALWQWADRASDEIGRIRRYERIRLCWGYQDLMAVQQLAEQLRAEQQPVADQQNLLGEEQNSTHRKHNTVKRNSDKQVYDKHDADHHLLHEVLGEPNTAHFNWIAEQALLRYEMLYEAELLPESLHYEAHQFAPSWQTIIGRPMRHDHRRVIATAISRLRAKLAYRPLIFGLMPEVFTLSQLQASVEALAGIRLHTQNFRRLVEHQNLIEATGESVTLARGRPAKLYRFCHDIELHTLLMDAKLPKQRSF